MIWGHIMFLPSVFTCILMPPLAPHIYENCQVPKCSQGLLCCAHHEKLPISPVSLATVDYLRGFMATNDFLPNSPRVVPLLSCPVPQAGHRQDPLHLKAPPTQGCASPQHSTGQ